MSDQLTILIVDDHPLFRKGLRTLLGTVHQVQVVGEAASGSEAVRLVEELQPDLVLMDLQMPNGDDLTCIRPILGRHPQTRILVVTMFEDDESVFAAMRAGARGYALKDMDDDDMLRAILAVGHGEAIFSQAVASRILSFFSQRSILPSAPFPELTESELKVLRLMARGLTNDAIAAQLSFSPKTVRNYVSAIFSKLNVADRAQAIVRAHDSGLG